MTPRLLAVRSVRSLAGGIRYSSRGIATEVQHASTSTSIVDDAPGPSRSTSKVRRTKLKDVIPHDPRRASLRGKVGFGLSVPSTKSAVLADKASKHRKKDGPVRSKDVKPRVRTENPFVLAPRLVEIYRKHGPEKALTELATSKREARTVPVHNILIKLLLKDGWIDTAYKVWMDVSPGTAIF